MRCEWRSFPDFPLTGLEGGMSVGNSLRSVSPQGFPRRRTAEPAAAAQRRLSAVTLGGSGSPAGGQGLDRHWRIDRTGRRHAAPAAALPAPHVNSRPVLTGRG